MIRQATPTDFPELSDIFHDANLIAHPFIDPDFIVTKKFRPQDEKLPLSESYVYEVNGDIHGFVSVSQDQINGLFVRVDRQRQGVGSQLLSYLKDRHEQLALRCFVDNYQAQRFYHSQGFEITEEKRFEALEYDEFIMRWSRLATH
jgi:putative acetyltransferase